MDTVVEFLGFCLRIKFLASRSYRMSMTVRLYANGRRITTGFLFVLLWSDGNIDILNHSIVAREDGIVLSCRASLWSCLFLWID